MSRTHVAVYLKSIGVRSVEQFEQLVADRTCERRKGEQRRSPRNQSRRKDKEKMNEVEKMLVKARNATLGIRRADRLAKKINLLSRWASIENTQTQSTRDALSILQAVQAARRTR